MEQAERKAVGKGCLAVADSVSTIVEGWYDVQRLLRILSFPVSTTPDPTFFYTTPVYLEAFAILQYGIEAKKGFIVVTGEVGRGKTTLLRRLMTHNFEGSIRTVFLFNTNLNFLELLQMLVCDLGLTITESNNKAVLLQELNKYLLAQLKRVIP